MRYRLKDNFCFVVSGQGFAAKLTPVFYICFWEESIYLISDGWSYKDISISNRRDDYKLLNLNKNKIVIKIRYLLSYPLVMCAIKL